MTVPSRLNALIGQINNELDNLDLALSETIELIRARITLFSENIRAIQIFATLNNYVLFAENTRRPIRETFQYLTINENLSDEDIQEAGEDLSEQIGRVLEAKIVVSNIKARLES
jgi:hypothetical protein